MTTADTIRVLNNAVILLDRGMFPGEQASAVFEARQYLAGLAASLSVTEMPADAVAEPAP